MTKRRLAVYAISVPVSVSTVVLACCYVLVRTWTDPKGRLDDVEDYFEHLATLPLYIRELAA